MIDFQRVTAMPEYPESPDKTPPMSCDLREALPVLLLAYECARDVDSDVWNFAVEISVLPQSGLTKTDLRWLVMKGYVEHRDEDTLPGQLTRNFRTASKLAFGDNSCFVLTELGTEFARNTLTKTVGRMDASRTHDRISFGDEDDEEDDEDDEIGRVGRNENTTDGDDGIAQSNGKSDLEEATTPCWDPHRRELRFMGRVVKQFKLPSPNQESLLNAFDEDDWPPRIDDPLPPKPNQDAKQRLNNTIKSLNRKQKYRLIRFMGDGTGEGILWESFAEDLIGNSQ